MTRTRNAGLGALMLMLCACTRTERVVVDSAALARQWVARGKPSALPDSFIILEGPRKAYPGDSVPSSPCAGRLMDPRDSTVLLMRTSTYTNPGEPQPDTTLPGDGAIADYSVVGAERYGVASNERLRLECRSYRGIAITRAPVKGT